MLKSQLFVKTKTLSTMSNHEERVYPILSGPLWMHYMQDSIRNVHLQTTKGYVMQ